MKDKLLKIQLELKAPKSLHNKFGHYNYRSAETILEAVKPLLKKHNFLLKISDELVNIGERYYIKATARLEEIEGSKYEETDGYAREEESKKGMDGSQITGASSSYARKYALNGMFLIDDSQDSDFTKEPEELPYKTWATKKTIENKDIEEMIFNCATQKELIEFWHLLTKSQQSKEALDWTKIRKQQLNDEGIYA